MDSFLLSFPSAPLHSSLIVFNVKKDTSSNQQISLYWKLKKTFYYYLNMAF